MLSLIGVILMTVTVSGAESMDVDNLDNGYIGMMPEVVVTAPGYYSEAEMGMLDEVIVTAPRYEGEDIAYCGIMPEVIVTAPRYKGTDPAPVLGSLLGKEPSVRGTNLVLIERMNSKDVGYFN